MFAADAVNMHMVFLNVLFILMAFDKLLFLVFCY